MAELKIVKDVEFLRKKSKPVTEFGSRLWQLLDDMRETLTAAGGVGLAAVQVGVLYRVCLVLDADGGTVELVNPVILSQSKYKIGDEGCLSIPQVYAPVERARKVKVRAQDRRGKIFERVFEKMAAVCAAHETDHMEGILFTDYIDKGAPHEKNAEDLESLWDYRTDGKRGRRKV